MPLPLEHLARQTPERTNNELTVLSLHERVLAQAVRTKRSDVAIRYTYDANGMRRVDALKNGQESEALATFRQDPVFAIATMRNNVMAVALEQRLSPLERKQRLRRYLDAFLSTQLKLDHVAFAPNDTVQQGVPDYIPDGLSDMGSENNPEWRTGEREKIRVNKAEIFRHARPLFEEILATDTIGWPEGAFKIWVAKRVAHFVYTEMPYDYDNESRFAQAQGHSVSLVNLEADRLAQCRHHALYTQVLLQAFGITSRLLKCDVDFDDARGVVPHVANLVRVNYQWHLLDSTNPDSKDGVGEIFMPTLSEKDIDTNHSNYQWQFRRKNGKLWQYRSRNNMYYRIRDNRRMPAAA